MSDLKARLKQLYPDVAGDLTPDQVGAALATLGAETVRLRRPGYRITTIAIAAELDPATARTIIGTIRAIAAADPLMDEMLYRLRGEGVELEHANTQAVLSALVAGGALTASHVDAINGMGYEHVAAFPGLNVEAIHHAWSH